MDLRQAAGLQKATDSLQEACTIYMDEHRVWRTAPKGQESGDDEAEQ